MLEKRKTEVLEIWEDGSERKQGKKEKREKIEENRREEKWEKIKEELEEKLEAKNNEKKKEKGRKRKKNPDLGLGAGKIQEFEENAPNGAGGSGRVRPHPHGGLGILGGFGRFWGFVVSGAAAVAPPPSPFFY